MGLKILHVVATPGHGSGRQVINLAGTMRDLGHDVHVVYSPDGITADFRSQLQVLTGVSLGTVPMARPVSLRDARSVMDLRAYIRRHGPFDVVHGHSSKAGAVARLAAIGTGAVRLYTPHALVTLDPLLRRGARWFYGEAERLLGRLSHGVIIVSPEERAEALSLGIPAHRLFVISPAVRAPRARPRALVRKELALAEDDVCIGFVGRLVAQKAVDRLLKATAIARQRQRALRLLVVGDGPLRQPLAEEAHALGLGDAVIWKGEVESAEIWAAIDIFALPSRFEGLSACIVEAMTLGIPVVATSCGGIDALVRDGVSGFVIPQGVEAEIVTRLAEAILTLSSDAALRLRMGQASREGSDAYDPHRVAAQTVDLYRALMLTRRDARPTLPSADDAFARPSMARPRAAVPRLADYASLAERRGEEVAPRPAVPLVSAVTVTFNAANTVARTIASVQAQTYPAVEHIVVDGGSTDGTVELVRGRLRPEDLWMSEADQGISDAFNKGIALARGEYVQLINADDWLSPDQLSWAVDALAKTGADFAFGDCLCYEGGKVAFRYQGDPDYRTTIGARMPPMNHPSMLVRRSAYERFGLYSLGFRNAMDYEWLARAHVGGAHGVYDPRILAHMSVDGVSIRQFRRTAREVRDISVMYGRRRLPAEAEYCYRVIKTSLSKPIKRTSKPLYDAVRSTINPAYLPLRRGR